MPEWVIPVLMLIGRLFSMWRAHRNYVPPWREPSQWILLVCFIVAALLVWLPTQPQWVRRCVQLTILALMFGAALAAGAFSLIF